MENSVTGVPEPEFPQNVWDFILDNITNND